MVLNEYYNPLVAKAYQSIGLDKSCFYLFIFYKKPHIKEQF